MKKRVKTDSSILSFVIILTGFLYLFPGLYVGNIFFDTVFDCLGLILIVKGNFLRMSARAHKKLHSDKSEKLVVDGLYKITRNPMYLGSFLIGSGFVLMIWPWWSLPVFAFLFYLRFNKQMVKEEKHLKVVFGKDFEDYCAEIPRIFPTVKLMMSVKTKELFNLKEIFITKEKRGLFLWPLLAICLESFQELLVFGITNVTNTLVVFLSTMIAFAIGFWFAYTMEPNG